MEPEPKNISRMVFSGKSISILLVDDNRVNQFLGRRILQNLGISKVDVVSNGISAFECLKNNIYDVILTDVEMPGMNGYELSKAIRSFENGNVKVTIIALTANSSDEDRKLATEAGIDDYLTKPYSPQDLQEILLKHLSKGNHIIMEDFVTLPKGNSSESIAKLYAVFHDNKDDVRQFLHMLSKQIPTLTLEIKQGILASDWDAAHHAAHKLKSPVKMLAEKELEDQLTQLIEILKEKHATETAAGKFEIIAPGIESLLVLVNRELEKLI